MGGAGSAYGRVFALPLRIPAMAVPVGPWILNKPNRTVHDLIAREWLASAASAEHGGHWDWRLGAGDATEAKEMHKPHDAVSIASLPATPQNIILWIRAYPKKCGTGV